MARLFILFGAVLEKGNADAFNTLGMEYAMESVDYHAILPRLMNYF